MNSLNSEIVNTLNILEKYSTQAGKGKDAQGREYLTLCEGAIALTADKTKEASVPQLSQYLLTQVSKLRSDVTHGTAEERAQAKKTILHALDVLATPLDDMEKELNAHLASNTIDIPSDNPFYETDLIVFKDDYQGALPLNGILEKDFALISNKINQLKVDGKTDGIEINPENTGPSDIRARRSQSMINAVVQLCTRQLGRDLLGGFSDHGKKIYINFSRSTAQGGVMEPGFNTSESLEGALFEKEFLGVTYGYKPDGTATITFNPELTLDLQVADDKREWNDPTPPFIVLGHEMVHAQHYLSDPKKFLVRIGTGHKESDTMEEFVTILGREQDDDPTFKYPFLAVEKDLLQESDDWGLALAESSFSLSAWDPKSENGLRSVYGLPPRTASHHDGTLQASGGDKAELFFQSLRKSEAAHVFAPDFQALVAKDYGWNNFLNKALGEACLYGRWETVRRLLSLGAELKTSSSYEEELLTADLIFAKAEKNHALVELLTGLGAVAPAPDTTQPFQALVDATVREIKSSRLLGHADSNRLSSLKKKMGSDADWGNFLVKLMSRLSNESSIEADVFLKLFEVGADPKNALIQHAVNGVVHRLLQDEQWSEVWPFIKLEIPGLSSLCVKAILKDEWRPKKEVIDLLTTLIDQCQLDLNSGTPSILMAAAEAKRFDLIEPIIQLGVDPLHKNNDKLLRTIFINKGKTELLESLVTEHGMNPANMQPLRTPAGLRMFEKLNELYDARTPKAD